MAFVPDGTPGQRLNVIPALKRWAIIKRFASDWRDSRATSGLPRCSPWLTVASCEGGLA